MYLNMRIPSSPSYSLGERILRTAVFQIGVGAGYIERSLMWVYKVFSKMSPFQTVLDTQKAEGALHSYRNLGGQIEFVVPQDGKAKIQILCIKAADLEQKLKRLGARWEKIPQVSSSPLLAIIPPAFINEEWRNLEKDLLKLKWKKRTVSMNDGETREVIVTCEDAEAVKSENPHLFIHANSASVSFTMLTRRVGFYLGCKQDICFYDPRGTWKSSGVASEAGYYNDIKAVYEKVKSHYPPHRIWVSSACGGSAPAAYLKSLTHDQGINFIFENGFTSLYKDYIEQENRLVRYFAKRYRAGLESRDIDPQQKPPETGFNVFELWKELKMTDIGKVIVVNALNDQRLPKAVADRNVALVSRVNSHVHHISFRSTTKDPHIDRYFNYADSRAKALQCIFSH